ncbi:MAG TPA: hypothetical protein VFM28_11185 [Nitrososphaeraceae archaeon]|nr:hypothetical protein [Nitrososphaeraceae archaeon]
MSDLYNVLEGFTSDQQKIDTYDAISDALDNTMGVSEEERNGILRCLQELGLIIPPP